MNVWSECILKINWLSFPRLLGLPVCPIHYVLFYNLVTWRRSPFPVKSPNRHLHVRCPSLFYLRWGKWNKKQKNRTAIVGGYFGPNDVLIGAADVIILPATEYRLLYRHNSRANRPRGSDFPLHRYGPNPIPATNNNLIPKREEYNKTSVHLTSSRRTITPCTTSLTAAWWGGAAQPSIIYYTNYRISLWS